MSAARARRTRPTLVISQGAKLSRPLRQLFTVERQHTPWVASCALGPHRFAWVDLHRPTRRW